MPLHRVLQVFIIMVMLGILLYYQKILSGYGAYLMVGMYTLGYAVGEYRSWSHRGSRKGLEFKEEKWKNYSNRG